MAAQRAGLTRPSSANIVGPSSHGANWQQQQQQQQQLRPPSAGSPRFSASEPSRRGPAEGDDARGASLRGNDILSPTFSASRSHFGGSVPEGVLSRGMRGREKGNSGGGSPHGGVGEFTSWPQTQQQAQRKQKRQHLEQSQNEPQQQLLAMRQQQERRKRQRQHEQPQEKSVGGLTGGWNSGVPEQQQQMAWGRPGQVAQSGQSGGQRQQQQQMWPSVRIFAVAVGFVFF